MKTAEERVVAADLFLVDRYNMKRGMEACPGQ